MHSNIGISWAGHASFCISSGSTCVWIDPFRITIPVVQKADIVLITHPHFDHCSEADIKHVAKPDAVIFAPAQSTKMKQYKLRDTAPGFRERIMDVEVEAIPAYNVKVDRLQFHPRANNWCGYILNIGGKRISHAGDTDFIEEMRKLSHIDYALVPIGGTYTMDLEEAIEAAHAIDSKHVVPMHYKALLGKNGSAKAEEQFKNEVKNALFLKEIQPPAYSF